MFFVVASGNIFRREFASYILSEAGHEVGEARTGESLLAALRERAPVAILLDLQLEGPDPAATLRAVRLLSAASILWIGEQRRTDAPLVDERPGALVSWPFRSDELLAAVAAVLGRADISADALAPRAREVGSVE